MIIIFLEKIGVGNAKCHAQLHIAPNAGHTAQNDSWTMQNDGRTTHNVGTNTHTVYQGPKGVLEEPPLKKL